MLVAYVPDTCSVVSSITSGIVASIKASHFSSKMPKNSLALGGALAGIYLSSINLSRISWMTASYQEITLLILSAFVPVLSLTVVMTTVSWSTTAQINSVDNSVFIGMFLQIWTSIISLIRKQCFAITCSHTMEHGPRYYFLGDSIYSREIPPSKMFISLTCKPHTNDLKRKQSDLFYTKASKDEGNLVSKPKLKIVHSGNPLEHFVLPTEDGSSRVKIPRIDVAIPSTPILAIPTQSIAPLLQATNEIKEHFKSSPVEIRQAIHQNLRANYQKESGDVNLKEELAHIQLPLRSQSFPSIERIPSFGKNLFNSRLRLDGSKGVCSPNDDEVESIRRANALTLIRILHECSIKPYSIRCLTPFLMDFFILKATILQRSVDVTPLESKVKGLIRQACDVKDLQLSYSDRPSAEEQDSCHMEVQGKLDEASNQLNTEGAHYEIKATELKNLSSQVATSEHLLQGIERKIDIINPTEVMDAATKINLEMNEA
ncbi:hypothetical protein Cgig2_021871 [Carnegiea gigantea]|uniref:Uncharacterized protein n=1 Tax=Carnegiea gigantea TaxID=171969 RepID=A0A9Q1GKR6_9CARY|nr:hypothetical protein Cgig2_021871 [Carnegiea gigantea]